MTAFLLMVVLYSTAALAGPVLDFLDYDTEPDRDFAILSPDGTTVAWTATVSGGGTGVFVGPAENDAADRMVWDSGAHPTLIAWIGADAILATDQDPSSPWLVLLVGGGTTVRLPGVTFAQAPGDGTLLFTGGGPEVLPELVAAGIEARAVDGPAPSRFVTGVGGLLAAVDERPLGDSHADGLEIHATIIRLVQPGGRSRLVRRPPDWPRVGAFSVFERAGPTFLLAIDGQSGPRAALVELELPRGRPRVVYTPERGEVIGALQEPSTGLPTAVVVRAERVRVISLDHDLDPDIALLDARFSGSDWQPTMIAQDGETWLLSVVGPTHEDWQFVYNRRTSTVSRVGPRWGAFDRQPWRPMTELRIPARDGIDIGAYLTTPDPETYGDGPWPGVVLAHGGPWNERYFYVWEFEQQRWAALGYAVLGVNFRGSDGYGRAFARLGGPADYATAMVDDLVDAAGWLARNGIAMPDRLAMTGVSYGGEASLLAATRYPYLLRCAVAVSSSGTLFDVSSRRLDFDYSWLGSRRTRAKLDPALHVGETGTQFLIMHGLEDAGVPVAQAQAFVDAATMSGASPTFVVFPNAGHGLGGVESGEAWLIREAFLSKCLGGAHEPLLGHLRAPLEVRSGLDNIPGLADALKAQVGSALGGG